MTTANIHTPDHADSAVSPDRFREVMGDYPTGVVIVTALAAAGSPIGMVVGSFTSVSLDPPLVAFLPMKGSRTFASLQEATSFCINILASDQEDVCRVFARSEPGRFERIGWRPSPSGAPILNGVVGWVDCEYASVGDAGDHYIVMGGVTALKTERDCLPLLFFQRGYGRFTPGSLVATGGSDMIDAVRLAEVARDEIENVARELGAECSVVAPIGNEAVFVAVANESPRSGRSRLGARVPFAPPLGTLLVGSPGAPTAEQWLARLGKVDEAVTERAREQLARTQRRGWSLSLLGSLSADDLDFAVTQYSNDSRTLNQERRFLAIVTEMAERHEPEELNAGDIYDVLNLSVPVRRPSGETVMVLRLGELPERATGAQIDAWRVRLQAAAAAVAQLLAGAQPNTAAA